MMQTFSSLYQGIRRHPRVRLQHFQAGFGATFSFTHLAVRPVAAVSLLTGACFGIAAIVSAERFVTQKVATPLRWRRATFSGQQVLSPLEKIAYFWDTMPPSTRAVLGIAVANVAVFALWRVPRLRHITGRLFLHTPHSGHLFSMIGSAFSHKEPLHLAMNMFALWSFGPLAYNALGPENFFAFYLSAGAVSSLVSQLSSVVMRNVLPGLGASGAIMALIALGASVHPNLQFSVMFLPMTAMSAQHALAGLMLFDTVGLLAGWRQLGHAAHLGGALYGLAFFYGHKVASLVQLPCYCWFCPSLL